MRSDSVKAGSQQAPHRSLNHCRGKPGCGKYDRMLKGKYGFLRADSTKRL